MALGSGISASLGKGEGTVHVNIQQIIVFVGFIQMRGFVLGSQSSWERDSPQNFSSYLFLFSLLKKKKKILTLPCSHLLPVPTHSSILCTLFFFCLSAQQYRTHAVRDNRVMKPDRGILCVVFCRINWRQKEKKGGRYEVK